MPSLLQRVLNSLISVAVSSIIGGLVAIAISVSQKASVALVVSSALAVFGLVALIGTFAVTAYRIHRQTLVVYPFPDFPVRVLEKIITYKIDDKSVLHFSRTIKVKALMNNVKGYVDKFVWTGGRSALPSAGTGLSEVSLITEAAIWTYYDSRFNATLQKNKETTFTNTWPELDWRGSKPFVSTASDEPTNKITFDITIPIDLLKNRDVIIEEMRSIESINPFVTIQTEKFDDNGHLSWSTKPGTYRHYRVRWSWASGDAVAPIPVVEDHEP